MENKPFDQSILTGFYSNLYRGVEKHDSPEMSRINMVKRIGLVMSQGIVPNTILNIGAGRQSLEKQVHTTYHNQPWYDDTFIATIDIADIQRNKLLAKKITNVAHTRASGLNLPFVENLFGLVVSNLAIDFLPHDAFEEAARVLAPDGQAIFQFHHPSLTEVSSDHQQVGSFWEYLNKNKILFQNEDQIKTELSLRGFIVNQVGLDTDGRDKWWVVNATKK